jgi:hypothetical protein
MVRFPKYIPACFLGIASRPFVLQSASQSLKSGTMGLALTLGLILGGCATKAPEKVVVEPTPSATTPIEPLKQGSEKPPAAVEKPEDDSAVPAQPDGEVEPDKEPATSDAMVPVTVYTIDDQCNDFVEQTLQVHSDNAIDEAVGQAIGAVDYNAFKLEGYQVSINGGTATVDMKLSPSSERKFVSLSSCEQRALFGSVEETLLNNPDWNVQTVKFTDNGKEIVL